MRTSRVFVDQRLETGEEIELPPSTSHYLTRVLRMQKHAPLVLFNGRGGEYEARITELAKRSCSITIGTYIDQDRQSPLRVLLGVGLSRGERMDLIMQKATELGAGEITPLFSERCEVKLPEERMLKRLEHWRNISISACEQSGRALLPKINPPISLDEWLTLVKADIKLMLEPGASERIPDSAKPASVALVAGPEGGLTGREINAAQGCGFQAVALGPRVLRAETAPIAALSIMQFQWGDMRPC